MSRHIAPVAVQTPVSQSDVARLCQNKAQPSFFDSQLNKLLGPVCARASCHCCCSVPVLVQLAQRLRLLDARRRARRLQEAQLRAALDALTADEAHAQQLVVAAQQTLDDVKSEAFAC